MLYSAKTRIDDALPAPLAANVIISQPGTPLVMVPGGTVTTDGTATNARFFGVSQGMKVMPSKKVQVELITVPDGGGNIQLTRRVSAGTTACISATPGVTWTTQASVDMLTATSDPSSPSAGVAAGWSAAGSASSLKFNTADAGKVLQVVYSTDLTVEEARRIDGDGVIGQNPIDAIKMVVGIRRGLVYTDQFDPGNDWAAEDQVRVSAAGKFVGGNTGATVNCQICEVPSVDVPFLGLLLL